MNPQTLQSIDKSTWGPGPWQDEPDRLEFEHAGLPCLLLRHPRYGNWCGYAAVPPGHPWHGKPYEEVDGDVEVHGGLTYSDACQGDICHVAKPGESDNVWWFGWDAAHAGDLSPGTEAIERTIPALVELRNRNPLPEWRHVYRDLAYVKAETMKLAEQLANRENGENKTE